MAKTKTTKTKTETKQKSSKSANGELIIERVFDAPLELVWRAWSDSELFMKWWGPKDFTCPVCKIDFKVGGKYLHCMEGPDGKRYWSTGVYKEIVPMKKIMIIDSFSDESGNIVPSTNYGMHGFLLEMTITITFTEETEGITKMVLKHEGIPEGETRDRTEQGWNESFDKLNVVLLDEMVNEADEVDFL